MIYIASNLKIRKGYFLFFFLFVAFLSGLKASSNAGGYTSSSNLVGYFKLKRMLRQSIVVFFLLGLTYLNAQITTNGLVLNLDASDTSSYSGSGSTWNDTSGNNKDFNINTATYNNDGYFVFDGNDGMTGPPSNSFGLSQTDHTIEIVLMNTIITSQTIINFRGNGGNTFGINAHVPWNNNNIYYDVGGCCGDTQRINGEVNILNQKVHVILRSKPSGSNRRQVFLNGDSIIGSGGNSTSNPGFSTDAANIGFLNSGGHTHYHKGRLYSVRVYNRALTDQEIANNYSYYQNPRNISLTSTTVSESVSIGTTIGTLSSSGMNQNGTFTYTLASSENASDDDNISFTISGTTLLTSTTLDYETKTSYNIYINVNDGSNNYAKAFTVSVTNINEAPTEISLKKNNVPQDGILLHLDSGVSNSYSGAGNIWTDISDNNYNGILQNSPSYSNSTDGLINLDGSTQWVQLNSFAGAITNTSSYTINLWFKSTETNATGNIYNNAIFSMHDSTGGNIFRIGAAPDSGKGLYYNFGVGAPEGRASSINLHNNQWHNALITKDTGAQAQFYIDNNLVTTNNASTNGTLLIMLEKYPLVKNTTVVINLIIFKVAYQWLWFMEK